MTTMLGVINHTFLSLISKKKEARSMGYFRSTAMCNTVYKIVTKVIANRLNWFSTKSSQKNKVDLLLAGPLWKA